jgi:hypothetical protein
MDGSFPYFALQQIESEPRAWLETSSIDDRLQQKMCIFNVNFPDSGDAKHRATGFARFSLLPVPSRQVLNLKFLNGQLALTAPLSWVSPRAGDGAFAQCASGV